MKKLLSYVVVYLSSLSLMFLLMGALILVANNYEVRRTYYTDYERAQLDVLVTNTLRGTKYD